jgi:hypothetical protein
MLQKFIKIIVNLKKKKKKKKHRMSLLKGQNETMQVYMLRNKHRLPSISTWDTQKKRPKNLKRKDKRQNKIQN